MNKSDTRLFETDFFWIFIVIIILFITSMSGFLINPNFDLTGMVVLSGADISTAEIESNLNDINDQYTKLDALQALKDTILIIVEMRSNGIPLNYANDVFAEAERIFQQAIYAEVLRKGTNNLTLKKEAESSLKLIDWKYIDYSDVIDYTNIINLRREEAYYILDLISATEMSIQSAKNEGMNITEAEKLLNDGKKSFYEDRFDEANIYLTESRNAVESARSQNTLLNSFAKNSKNFFERYWKILIILLILFFVLAIIFYRQISTYLLKKKIARLKVEQNVLINLIKQTQTDRFVNNKISRAVYEIRIKKYKQRMNLIKQQLPVLEARLYPRRKLN